MSVLERKNTFNEIYTAYYRRSFLFVRSYIHDPMTSEDIASESLIKLWQYLPDHPEINIELFLLTILKNKALDYLRHEQTKQRALKHLEETHQRELDLRISSLQNCDPDQIFSKEILYLINQTLDSLPERTRSIFKMSRFETLTNREIADKIGLSVKDVEYHMSKSLKILRIALKDYLPVLAFFSNDAFQRILSLINPVFTDNLMK